MRRLNSISQSAPGERRDQRACGAGSRRSRGHAASASGGAVVEAQAGGDVDVLRADDVAALEVGDRAGDAQDAGVAAGRERVAVVELAEQAQRARRDVAELADLAGGELGVAALRLAREAGELALARRDHALRDLGGGRRDLAAQGLGAAGARRA